MKISEIINESVLTERVINLFTQKDKDLYKNEVWNLLQSSYVKAGGFKTAATPEELIQKSGLWKIIIRDETITAANIYKDQDGRKSIASGTNGTPQGVADYKMIKREDTDLKRAWAEVSGGAEKIMAQFDTTPLSNKYAAALLGKEILERNPDGYHYTRLIQGSPHEKIIYGTINLSPNTAKRMAQAGISLHDLPKNFSKLLDI